MLKDVNIKFNIILILILYMSLAGSINDFYRKYKKIVAILILVFFMYKLFNYYYGNIYEGLMPPKCSSYKNCNDCINNNFDEGNLYKPCGWSKYKKQCNYGKGYLKVCSK